MAAFEEEAFRAWLIQREVPAEYGETYVAGVRKLVVVAGGERVLPKHVDLLLQQEEAAGTSPKRLANLQRIGQAYVDFRIWQGKLTPPVVTAVARRATPAPGVPAAPAPAPAGGEPIEREPIPVAALLFAFVPLVLVFLGGLVGGAFGGAAAALNLWLARRRMNLGATLAIQAAVAAAAVLLWWLLLSTVISARS